MSSVIIRHLRVPLFFASSSSMDFGLSQVGIHNVPYRTGDYTHMMKSQRKLVKASQTHSQPRLRSDFSLRIYGVIYHGGDCRNAGNSGQCHLMYWLSSSDALPAVFVIRTEYREFIVQIQPKSWRKNGRMLFLTHSYHVLEPWKVGKTRLA